MNGPPFDGLDHRARGRLGESEARRWLVAEGYTLVELNFSCRAGEIDVIAERDGVLCFIEIKARANATFGRAVEALSRGKMKRIARAASLYLVEHPTDLPCRFDVVAMDFVSGGWQFTLVPDAFSVG